MKIKYSHPYHLNKQVTTDAVGLIHTVIGREVFAESGAVESLRAAHSKLTLMFGDLLNVLIDIGQLTPAQLADIVRDRSLEPLEFVEDSDDL